MDLLPQDPGHSEHPACPSGYRRFFLKLFDFSGRAGRLEFLLYSQLVPIGLLTVMTVLALVIAPNSTADDPVSDIGAFLWFVISLTIVAAAGSRRLHDLGRSGWFMLLAVVPLVNLYLLSVLFFSPGKRPVSD